MHQRHWIKVVEGQRLEIEQLRTTVKELLADIDDDPDCCGLPAATLTRARQAVAEL